MTIPLLLTNALPVNCNFTDLGNSSIRMTACEKDAKLIIEIPQNIALSANMFLNFDVTYEGENCMCFALDFMRENGTEPFYMSVGLLPRVKAQISLPLSALDSQNVFSKATPGRQKTTLGGKPFPLNELAAIGLRMERIAAPSAILIENLCISATEQPYDIPDVKLVDEMGQAVTKQWRSKTKSAEDLVAYLKDEQKRADPDKMQDGLSEYGGYLDMPLGAGTGFFRTVQKDGRWWLADPLGYAFVSVGLDCIDPHSIGLTQGVEKFHTWLPSKDDPAFKDAWMTQNGGEFFSFATANLIRAFGKDWFENWAHITKSRLREWGINTIANWSSPEFIRYAKMPYVWPLSHFPSTKKTIFRDFPDVYSDEYLENSQAFAEQIEPMKDDPYLIGYFLSNEPHWAFGDSLNIAEELLASGHVSATKIAFIDHLRQKYNQDVYAFNHAWNTKITTFEDLQIPIRNARQLSPSANADIGEFSKEMVRQYIAVPSKALRAIDPNHLNLGIRYAWFTGEALLGGLEHFDVFSFNCYAKDPTGALAAFSEAVDLPLMIGEYHHGALDVGLWATGLGAVSTQKGRGQAYRRYTEHALAHPACVGAHYFILNDQPLLGRSDGENYQIGFVDVCHRPYDAFVSAVRDTTDTMYQVAAGDIAPYNISPEYVDRICF